MKPSVKALGLALASFTAIAAASAQAAPVFTTVGADLSASPFTFDAGGGTFTFGFNGDYFGSGPVTVSTANGGEVNTIFGQPTTYFTDRGQVSFGPSMQYAAFGSETPIRFTIGDNFIGLRAVNAAGDAFYGFAYTTNNVFNGYAFESTANTAITATTAFGGGAVPEPATWGLMILGFGAVGGAMRARRTRMTVRFA